MSLPIYQVLCLQQCTVCLMKNEKELSINTIKKLCDGLGITLGEFFETELFDNLEQEIK